MKFAEMTMEEKKAYINRLHKRNEKLKIACLIGALVDCLLFIAMLIVG